VTEIEKICDMGKCLSILPLQDLSNRDLTCLYAAQLIKNNGENIDARDILDELDRRADDWQQKIYEAEKKRDEAVYEKEHLETIISQIEDAMKSVDKILENE
jgi:septal ring factor EnvC (AmiA/AmiB activator)